MEHPQMKNGKVIPHISPPAMWMSKLGLRALSIIFIIAAVGLGGSYISAASSYYDCDGYYDYCSYSYSSIYLSIPIIAIAPSSALALIWDISECICISVRGGHRGIHPGAVVALDLLIWLGYLSATVALSLLGYAASVFGVSGGGGNAIVGLGATLIIVHFTLFVIACYETHVRNTSATRVIGQLATQNTQPQYQAGGQVAVPQQAYAHTSMHQGQMPPQMQPQYQQYQQYQQQPQQMQGFQPQMTSSPPPVYMNAPGDAKAGFPSPQSAARELPTAASPNNGAAALAQQNGPAGPSPLQY
ncbi:hypothetical protein MKZ38_010226 [Zalerion maritima]|uniref:Uncharacterized protein n=1 Tax=Zalerion maritima TaxID=339359 RepID=A0AAD5RG31_9PEZI|nr:hypothetical protein MKZ38_010226 [Zalerion maritima]